MADIKGPAVDPESFRVEGHCCAIRLPGVASMTESGIVYKLTPEARAQLVREGVLPPECEFLCALKSDENSTEK